MKKSSEDLRGERTRKPVLRTPRLYVAAPWPKKTTNLGTLVRTCDAVGARLVIPDTEEARRAVRRGNTVRRDELVVHFPFGPMNTLIKWSQSPSIRVIGIELAYGATPLKHLRPADSITVTVLGHETTGIPDEAMELLDEVVEIPMLGCSNSLNVAVAASLVLYKLTEMI